MVSGLLSNKPNQPQFLSSSKLLQLDPSQQWIKDFESLGDYLAFSQWQYYANLQEEHERRARKLQTCQSGLSTW